MRVRKFTKFRHVRTRRGTLPTKALCSMGNTALIKWPQMVKGLRWLDGNDKRAYRDWKTQVKNRLNMSATVIYDILTDQENPKPTDGSNLAKWQRNNTKLYSYLRPSYKRRSHHRFTASRGEETGR